MEKVKSKTSPKDFFMHLLALIALYATAIAFTTVVWQIINLGIPDPLEYYQSHEGARSLLRGGLSFLIVLFPVYVFTAWRLHKSYVIDTSKRNVWVRKWLTYFTLFVASLVIIFNTVSLLNHFLDGELTLRFFLKLLTIFFVAGTVFGYYLWELKKFKAE